MRAFGIVLTFACSLACVRQAAAYEANVQAASVLQIYSVRSPWGAPVLSRQRLTHTLSFEFYRPAADPRESKVSFAFHARLRLDGDYGISQSERDPNSDGTFVPGLYVAPLDLSYAYLEINGLLANTVSTRLGRQITFDELGFWSYDGARLSFAPSGLFELSGYAGFEQRGGVPFFGTSRYEADGVYRGDRANLASNLWPSYLNSTEPAPAFGASLALTAFPWLRARADYRRVTQHDTVFTVPFADADGNIETFSGNRTSSERVGFALGADIWSKAAVDGAWVYDVYRRVAQQHRLAASYRVSPALRLRSAYLYRLPVFDADSIFNWFGAKGSILTELGASLRLSERLELTANAGIRWLGIGPRQWLGEGAFRPGVESGLDWLGRLESMYVLHDDTLGASTSFESGDAGDRMTTDVWHRRSYWERRLESRIQLGAGRWQHPLMTHRGESSLLYVLGMRLHPGGKPEMGAEWEHVISDRVSHRFRILATLSARWP